MKKSVLALVVLGATAGAAQAASSVTMYGRADVAYSKTTGSSLMQSGGGETRLGIKGQEDLGNGLAATFQLEGRFDLDTGAKTANRSFFDRESTVGLKGSFGHVRLGRSISMMDRGIAFVNVGRRATDLQAYASATRHSNGLFYTYANGPYEFGADVTTKGSYNEGQSGSTDDGVIGQKPAFGAYGKYSANGLTVGLAYQADGKKAAKTIAKEFGAALSYKINPVTLGVSYAQGNDNVVGSKAKSRIWEASASIAATADDTINLIYRNDRRKNTVGAVTAAYKRQTAYGLGYIHTLSKRTSIYADVARTKDTVANTKATTWDLALRHNF
ncbi:Outer membrane porin protein 32 [Ephemeroptericola cinctiostellae]|uniref:Outer membrane porin protein 32 n=1 Tax=Ephemeroptericola cinctiostellae TaxID=2268024 RepID=A0A345D8H8_9BURK|nr:porin [Ephemeroptericola cinctiostellae]AXF84666.1 Outer membrane porin protein 32 [Ephemeroptericola cinctiostellae]